MINYPNGKSFHASNPPNLHSSHPTRRVDYGNRGMTLEDDLNTTNRYYREQHIALIHKKPTPLQIVNVDYPKRSAARITEAYFKKPSTTDYNGVYKGKYIDFEAKETQNKTALPLQNFHEHQIQHMQQVKEHGGIAFIIVKFSSNNEVYLLDAQFLFKFWQEQQDGGRKSIPKHTFVSNGFLIPQSYRPRIDYLKAIDQYYL
ncbi:Holliday junction resolvase RecU [Pullulanibacillus camelliae]|uniref:Holliday junction resolvase RecU n=1 Tax=Pullulanibacillus camelliae TaxID=1707096 RepID=A0A8J2YGZ6_9BACL|nr:Holliday junction resolvase RecU [Pullulanibacillus camelliae]GGE39079.1 Holliday junction resolvase RecU [Pullulanibacillus camelliae]